MPPFEEYEELIRKLWDSHWLTNMGPYHEALREQLRNYLSVAGVELFVNGHMGLEFVLQAFELEGEVITTPFTFASTTHAIVRSGLEPVMCDVKESDGTLNPDCLEALVTERTCAIVPVHVYGHICDDAAIEAVAKRHSLKVIYDAAHAFGERVNGRGVGTLGDASMFSFHATKVFHTIEGGAVVWSKAASAFLAQRLYQLKDFGILGKESVVQVGGNGKMNEFAAAMGLCNLKHVEEWIAARKQIYLRYAENLKGLRGLRLLEKRPDVTYNYAYVPVVLEGGAERRDAVYEQLCASGIYPRKYFYPCVNAYECYRERFDENDTPVAKQLAAGVLTLPIYPELSLDEVDEICALLEEVLKK